MLSVKIGPMVKRKINYVYLIFKILSNVHAVGISNHRSDRAQDDKTIVPTESTTTACDKGEGSQFDVQHTIYICFSNLLRKRALAFITSYVLSLCCNNFLSLSKGKGSAFWWQNDVEESRFTLINWWCGVGSKEKFWLVKLSMTQDDVEAKSHIIDYINNASTFHNNKVCSNLIIILFWLWLWLTWSNLSHNMH